MLDGRKVGHGKLDARNGGSLHAGPGTLDAPNTGTLSRGLGRLGAKGAGSLPWGGGVEADASRAGELAGSSVLASIMGLRGHDSFVDPESDVATGHKVPQSLLLPQSGSVPIQTNAVPVRDTTVPRRDACQELSDAAAWCVRGAPSSAAGGSSQQFAHGQHELGRQKWLLQKMNARVEHAVVLEHVLRVARDEQDAQLRPAQREPLG